MDSVGILGSSLNRLLFKNDHLHLTQFGYEKLSLLFVSQLNTVLGKTHETPKDPQLACSYKSAIFLTLNKEEFPPLYLPRVHWEHLLIQLHQVRTYKKVLEKLTLYS